MSSSATPSQKGQRKKTKTNSRPPLERHTDIKGRATRGIEWVNSDHSRRVPKHIKKMVREYLSNAQEVAWYTQASSCRMWRDVTDIVNYYGKHADHTIPLTGEDINTVVASAITTWLMFNDDPKNPTWPLPTTLYEQEGISKRLQGAFKTIHTDISAAIYNNAPEHEFRTYLRAILFKDWKLATSSSVEGGKSSDENNARGLAANSNQANDESGEEESQDNAESSTTGEPDSPGEDDESNTDDDDQSDAASSSQDDDDDDQENGSINNSAVGLEADLQAKEKIIADLKEQLQAAKKIAALEMDVAGRANALDRIFAVQRRYAGGGGGIRIDW